MEPVSYNVLSLYQTGELKDYTSIIVPSEDERTKIPHVEEAIILYSVAGTQLVWTPPPSPASPEVTISWCPPANSKTPTYDANSWVCNRGVHHHTLTGHHFKFPHDPEFVFILTKSENNVSSGMERVQCRTSLQNPHKTEVKVVNTTATSADLKMKANVCDEGERTGDLYGVNLVDVDLSPLVIDTWDLYLCPTPMNSLLNCTWTKMNTTATTISGLNGDSCYNVMHTVTLKWNIPDIPSFASMRFCTGMIKIVK